jgi:hypothetical protein
MKPSAIVKSMVGLLSMGKSDFEEIEPFRNDRFFSRKLRGFRKSPVAPGSANGSMLKTLPFVSASMT